MTMTTTNETAGAGDNVLGHTDGGPPTDRARVATPCTARRRAAVVLASTAIALVVATSPLAGWRISRLLAEDETVSIDPLVDPLLVILGLVGVAALIRICRPDAGPKRWPLVPTPFQIGARRIVELAVTNAGSLQGWTTTDPDTTLDRVARPHTIPELHRQDDLTATLTDDDDNGTDTDGDDPVESVADTSVDVASTDHVVGRGETFWSLAEQHLGDGKRWTELRDLNAGRPVAPGVTLTDTDGLRSGWTIRIPTDEGKIR